MALAIAAALAACTHAPPIEPTGPTSLYVVTELDVPSNNMQARAFGLDLNGDGKIDNQLGAGLATLEGLGFGVVEANAAAVASGGIALRLEVQAPGDNTAHVAGFAIDLGAPRGALVGPVTGDSFAAGPGELSIQLALGFTDLARTTTMPVSVDLIGARVDTSTFAEIGTAAGPIVIAGAIVEDEIGTALVPALVATLQPFIARDCTGASPGCGCVANSLGADLVDLFGATATNCTITVDEAINNSVVRSLFTPDVTIDGKQALSFGMRVLATPAP